MTIHRTRRSSMTWSYVGFGLTLVAVVAALALVAAGWVTIEFPAWRLAYLLAPVTVAAVMLRLVRTLRER